MTHLDLFIPDDLGAWAEAQAIEARLNGAGEYLAELLQRERTEVEKLSRLQTAIEEGRASGISERDPFEYLEELRVGLRRSINAA